MSVEIPNFCGAEISAVAVDERFELQTEYRYDAETPAGVVLSQSPVAGSRRKLTAEVPQCTVALVVSLGEETLSLPDVVGKDARETVAALREMGFTVEVVTRPSAYPEGTILSMSPQGGTELPSGETVTLTVSAGTPSVTVTVPDLRGLSRSDALVQLWLAQLSAGDVIEEDSEKAIGSVIRQSHQPGTVVTAGTAVTLYISRGFEE